MGCSFEERNYHGLLGEEKRKTRGGGLQGSTEHLNKTHRSVMENGREIPEYTGMISPRGLYIVSLQES